MIQFPACDATRYHPCPNMTILSQRVVSMHQIMPQNLGVWASAAASVPRFQDWQKRTVPVNDTVWETGVMFFCRCYLGFLQKRGARRTDLWFAFPQMRAIIASKHRVLWYSYIVAFLPMYKAHPAKTGVAKLQGLTASNCLRQPAAEWRTYVFMPSGMILG